MRDPELPEDLDARDLASAARNELKTLSKENADRVALHLAAAARFIETDPERAHEHAQAAVRHAGRIGVARETLAVTAYATGDFSLALRELRTHRRITGREDNIALIVDSERGVGRPEKALEEGHAVDRMTLDVATRVELAIAMSGARLDLDQTELALSELDIPELDPDRAFSWSPGLFAARANVLEDLGRDEEAAQWRRRAEIAEDALGLNDVPDADDFMFVDEIEELELDLDESDGLEPVDEHGAAQRADEEIAVEVVDEPVAAETEEESAPADAVEETPVVEEMPVAEEKPKRTRAKKARVEDAPADAVEETPVAEDKPKRTRATKAAPVADAVEETPVEETPVEEEKPKRTRAKKAAPVEDAPAEVVDEALVAEVPVAEEKPKRARAKKAAPVEEAPVAEEKPKRARAKKAAPVEDAPAEAAEETRVVAAPVAEDEPKRARAKKAAPVEEAPVAEEKPKRTRAKKAALVEDAPAAAAEQTPLAEDKPKRARAKKAAPAKAAPSAEPTIEDEVTQILIEAGIDDADEAK